MVGLKAQENNGGNLPGHVKCLLAKQLAQQVIIHNKLMAELDAGDFNFMDFPKVNDLYNTTARIRILCSKLNQDYQKYTKGI